MRSPCVPPPKHMTLKNANAHLGQNMNDVLSCGSGVSQPAHMLRSLAEHTVITISDSREAHTLHL